MTNPTSNIDPVSTGDAQTATMLDWANTEMLSSMNSQALTQDVECPIKYISNFFSESGTNERHKLHAAKDCCIWPPAPSFQKTHK